MQYATTISHEKKAQQRDKEDITVRRGERQAYQNLTKDVYAYVFYWLHLALHVSCVVYTSRALFITALRLIQG